MLLAGPAEALLQGGREAVMAQQRGRGSPTDRRVPGQEGLCVEQWILLPLLPRASPFVLVKSDLSQPPQRSCMPNKARLPGC